MSASVVVLGARHGNHGEGGIDCERHEQRQERVEGVIESVSTVVFIGVNRGLSLCRSITKRFDKSTLINMLLVWF